MQELEAYEIALDSWLNSKASIGSPSWRAYTDKVKSARLRLYKAELELTGEYHLQIVKTEI